MLKNIYYKIKTSGLYSKFCIIFTTFYLLSGVFKSSLIMAIIISIAVQLLPWEYFE